MTIFLDTSVLVAALQGGHSRHEPSFALYKEAGLSCAAHSLAEIYSVLTRLPGKQRVNGDQALLFIEEIKNRLSIIPLNAEEYFRTLQNCAAMRITGGTVYDALLAACALKAGAEVLFTWNVRHFQQLGPEIAGIVRTP